MWVQIPPAAFLQINKLIKKKIFFNKMAKSSTIWESIFWIALAVIALWILFKALGLIKTPVWIELIPYAGALFAAGAAFQILKDIKADVKILTNYVDKMANGLIKLENKFEHI